MNAAVSYNKNESVDENDNVEMQSLMTFMWKLTIFGENFEYFIRSSVGAICAYSVAWIFDLSSNAFAINLVFSDKIAETLTFGADFFSLLFSAFGSSVIGIGMLVLAMYRPSGKLPSILLMILSILISYSGFMLFIVPDLSFSKIELTFFWYVQAIFLFLISCMSPLLMFVISERLNKEDPQRSKELVKQLSGKGRSELLKGFGKQVSMNYNY